MTVLNDIRVDRSKIHGLGLFAKRNLKAGSVFSYLSKKLMPSLLSPRYFYYRGVNERLMMVRADNPYIIFDEDGTANIVLCEMKYLNHSDDPNCCYYDDNSVVLLKDVHYGEELTHDYGKQE